MAWIIIGAVCIILLAAEACFIIPDKLPFIRKKVKKDDHSERPDR